jgi:hypothetical protein
MNSLGDLLLHYIDYASDFDCFIDIEMRPRIRRIIKENNVILNDDTINYPNMENLWPVFLLSEELSTDDYFFVYHLKLIYYDYLVNYYTSKYPDLDFETIDIYGDLFRTVVERENLELPANSYKQDDFIGLLTEYSFTKDQIAEAKEDEQLMYLDFLENSPHIPRFTQRKFLNVSLYDLLSSRSSFTNVLKNFVKGLYNFFKGYTNPRTVDVPEVYTTSIPVNLNQNNSNLIREI